MCEIKNGSLFCKTDYAKGLATYLENVLADDPLPRMSKKRLNFRSQRRLSGYGFWGNFILASTAHERITIGYVVS